MLLALVQLSLLTLFDIAFLFLFIRFGNEKTTKLINSIIPRMISIGSLCFILFISLSSIVADENLEHLSVNTGERVTFICDLPEKYSNQRVSSLTMVDDRFCLTIE